MTMKELQSLNTEELQEQLEKKRETLRELRFKVSLDEHKKIRELRVLKKDIARILTLLNKKPEKAEKIDKLEA